MKERKLGVFICYCGGNISDYVDVEKVREEVAREPGVVTAQTNMFTCSDAAQQNIINEIKEKNLDGIVVASCSPKLHLNTFRAMSERAGLNPYQYIQVNIREQCSWAHTHNTDAATEKAVHLIKGGIAKAALTKPLEKQRVETTPATLIIGAGVAGLRAAIALSDMGINVHLIEKEAKAGGIVPTLGKLFPNNRNGADLINSLVDEVRKRESIDFFTNAELVEKKGGIGKFEVRIQVNGTESISLTVGSIIVATGFDSYSPDEGEFGFSMDGAITLPEYMELLGKSKGSISYRGKPVKSVSYLYCVGSREHGKEKDAHQYCSRYCCSAAVHASLLTDEVTNGNVHQFHFFRDMRTYGKYELLYEKALQEGALFIRFKDEEPPVILSEGERIKINAKDQLSGGEEIEVLADLLVLVTGMTPRENRNLINVLKLPVGLDGFFNEIHPKLRPVETVIDGVFIAGTAQGPKTLSESVTSSMAAVAKSGALLLKGYVDLEPLVAMVNPDLCAWCGACLEVCPFEAIEKTSHEGKEVAQVNTVLCKGEGACVAVCEAQAINVEGYTNQQMFAMIDAMAKEVQ